MDFERILSIVLFLCSVAVFAWGLYEKIKGKATTSASAFISQVESSGLLGKEKMALVVNWLYELIPAPFKGVLDKETLETLAQRIFDYMKKYALAYQESHTEKGNESLEAVNDELASDIAKSLSELSSVGLKVLAMNLGIDVTGKEDSDIIKEIVLMLAHKA